MKKYELFESAIIHVTGKPLFQIRALRDFGAVRAGDIGGYVESEHNLSHDNNAWIGGHAEVTGWAQVSGNALVDGNASISDRVIVTDDAHVGGWAQLYGDAKITGKACITAMQPDPGPAAVRYPSKSKTNDTNPNPLS